MYWLIQNLSSESTFENLKLILSKLDIPWRVVKYIPFSNKIVDASISSGNIEELEDIKIDTDLPVIGYGSYGLARTLKEKGFRPGAFISDNFNHEQLIKYWGAESMLNGEAIFDSFENISLEKVADKFFVRPTEDTKSFSGMVMHKDEFSIWRKDVLKTNSPSLTPDTQIMISSLKEIYTETRLFVVHGRIVTGSVYKRGTRVVYDTYISSDILEFAQNKISQWQPEEAFVLDVADTSEGIKLIEVNNINSSGIYASDLFKIVTSLEDLYA